MEEKKRRRKSGLLLLLLLLIAGIGVGTYAWFTARVNISSNLKITTGSINLTATGDTVWVLQDKANSEVTNKDVGNSFQNVRPGDSFVKTITLTNAGTLKQKLTFTINRTLPTSVANIFTLEIPNYTEVTLNPNQTKVLTIKLTLKGAETGNEQQTKNIDFTTLNATNFITVDAKQINAP